MARSTYFDLGRSADACPGSESGYAQRFQCGNIVKRRIWTRMTRTTASIIQNTIPGLLRFAKSTILWLSNWVAQTQWPISGPNVLQVMNIGKAPATRTRMALKITSGSTYASTKTLRLTDRGESPD